MEQFYKQLEVLRFEIVTGTLLCLASLKRDVLDHISYVFEMGEHRHSSKERERESSLSIHGQEQQLHLTC